MRAYVGRARPGGRRPAGLAAGALLLATVCATPAAAATAPPAAASQVPAGTVSRTEGFVTDSEGRAIVLHGVLVPAGAEPTAADAEAWVTAGFSAAALTVPVTSAGHFPDPLAGTAGLAATDDAGITRAGQAIRTLTDHGLRVALRIVPAGTAQPSPQAFTAAVSRLAAAFRSVGGLVGYEITAQEAKIAPGAGGAIAAVDPFHLLWRERVVASINPAATLAVNDPTGYLTYWPGGEVAIPQFTAAADSNRIGWFYSGTPRGDTTGTGASVSFPGALEVPYPIAVAGSPTAFGVDAATGAFFLRYQTALPSGQTAPAGLLSAVSLPARAFPTGYTVSVTGATVTSRAGSGLLCLAAAPGATEVSLTVSRAPAGAAPVAPPAAGAVACPAVAAQAAAGPTVTPTAQGSPGSDEYEGPLLWALPLLGAAVMALLLVVPFRMLRRVGRGRDNSPSWENIIPPRESDDDADDEADLPRPAWTRSSRKTPADQGS